MYEGPDSNSNCIEYPSSAVWLGQESHRKIQLTALNLEKQLGEAWKTVANAGANGAKLSWKSMGPGPPPMPVASERAVSKGKSSSNHNFSIDMLVLGVFKALLGGWPYFWGSLHWGGGGTFRFR